MDEQRVVVDDELDRIRVIGIDPENVLLFLCPRTKFLFCDVFKLFQVGVEFVRILFFQPL